MESLIELLYTISTALLVPVLVGLLLLCAWTLAQVGGALSEWRERRRLRVVRSRGKVERFDARALLGSNELPGFVGIFAARYQQRAGSEEELGATLAAEIEVEASAGLARVTFGARVGPMLGLMGTLIPMGPALLSLTEGNFEAMVADIVVAFSTTVVGLVVGAVCYALLLLRRHWYARDLTEIERLVRGLER